MIGGKGMASGRTMRIAILFIAVMITVIGTEASQVDIDVKCAKGIEGTFTWGKNQFNVVHMKLPGRNAPDSVMNYLLTDLGVELGRTGKGPFRMGANYLRMPESTRWAKMKDDGEKMINHVLRDPRMTPQRLAQWENDDLIMSDGAEVLDHLESSGMSGFEFGRFAGRMLKAFHKPEQGVECPRMVEPLNEPMVHVWKKNNPHLRGQELMQWKRKKLREVGTLHRQICEGIRHETQGQPLCKPLCGGWAAGWLNFSNALFATYKERLVTFVEEAGKDMDFISYHAYDSTKTGMQESKTSGGYLDSVFDLTQTHLKKTVGFKPLVISEYGAASNQVWYREIPGRGKVPTDYCEDRDWPILHSVSAMMMQFSNYPHMILKAVPFLTILDDAESANPSPWSLQRTVGGVRRNTHLMKIYEIMAGVDGDYRRVNHEDPQLFAHVLANGKEIYILLKNMIRQPKTVNLNFVSGFPNLDPSRMELRRLYLQAWDSRNSFSHCARINQLKRSGKPVLDITGFGASGSLAFTENLTMRPEEFIVIRVPMTKEAPLESRVNVKYFYSSSLVVPVKRERSGWTPKKLFVFNDSLPQGIGVATIRVSYATHSPRGVRCMVWANGRLVPGNPATSGPELSDISRWTMLEYYTDLATLTPAPGLKTRVEVSCTIYHGHISTVTIVTEKDMDYTGEDTPLDRNPPGGPPPGITPPEIDDGGGDGPGIDENPGGNGNGDSTPAKKVRNGNFEKRLKYWTTMKRGNGSIKAVWSSRFGRRAAKLQNVASVRQGYKVVPGQEYELSVQVRAAMHRMKCYYSVKGIRGSSTVLRKVALSTKKDWTKGTLNFKVPEGLTRVYLQFSSWKRYSTCMFDNVEVRKVSNNPLVQFAKPIRQTIPVRGSFSFKLNFNLNQKVLLETLLWKGSRRGPVWHSREIVPVNRSKTELTRSIKIWGKLRKGWKYNLTARVYVWMPGNRKRILGEKTIQMMAQQ